MMEALAAVGLAGNVVQFVQFSGQLLSETIAIKRTGNPTSLPHLKACAEEIVKQSAVIQLRLNAGSIAEPLNEEDQVSAMKTHKFQYLLKDGAVSSRIGLELPGGWY